MNRLLAPTHPASERHMWGQKATGLELWAPVPGVWAPHANVGRRATRPGAQCPGAGAAGTGPRAAPRAPDPGPCCLGPRPAPRPGPGAPGTEPGAHIPGLGLWGLRLGFWSARTRH